MTNKVNVRVINGFKVLSTFFPNIEIASGGIICTEEELIPLGNEKYLIPIDYIWKLDIDLYKKYMGGC